ncbi:MAG: thioredoxin family protein [Candidatus Micrarchaeota archaeon]
MRHGKSWIILMALFCVVLLYFFSNGGSGTKEEKNWEEGNKTAGLAVIELTDETAIPPEECEARGLCDMAVVLESKYCAACKKVAPTLDEVENETGISFLRIDLSSSEGAGWTERHGLRVHYTPTVLINCEIIIGTHEKQDYLAALERAMG